MGTGYLARCKMAGHGTDHPPPSSTKVIGGVQLYVSFPLTVHGLTYGVFFVWAVNIIEI